MRLFANLPVTLATKLGISLGGAWTLTVRGRSSGEWRSTPVNPLTIESRRYLVAPRGETHWARNLRASGEARLTLGRKETAIRANEVANADKLPILRAYLDRWGGVTHKHFGLPRHPGDGEIASAAERTPVFEVFEEEAR
jgi:deazaflavin-dependent oxidoreductase (nitroreductase family)